MPTKRKRVSRQSSQRFTPAALEAFCAGDAHGLSTALRLPPWHVHPHEAIGPCPSDVRPGGWHDTWEAARAIRKALEAATGVRAEDIFDYSEGTDQ